MAAWRAELNDADMCGSCFGKTKYTCLKCEIPIGNKCSIFEQDEDHHRWVVVKASLFANHVPKRRERTSLTPRTTNLCPKNRQSDECKFYFNIIY